MICSTNDTMYFQKSEIAKGNAEIAKGNTDNDPDPIEFYRITHTNKDDKMSDQAYESYVSKLIYLFMEHNCT